ncbi:GTPase HflX [Candidatus Uhrbacteria bacterium]|nr:MAG: GTPase HflX [Candidatus Uhrbacteria bacterium]
MPIIPNKPRAILIDVIPPSMDEKTAKRRIEELELLTKTYGGMIIIKLMQKKGTPDYRTYLGGGKMEEIIELANKEKAEALIINNLLKPGQMFNVNEALRKAKLNMQAWDRVDLILKIFDRHAKTAEAKLQIKLAAIHHMGPRIYGMGMELMQQKGGTSTRGGQGETNTELMKRHLFEQEQKIKRDLERVNVARKGHRARRDRVGLKTVSVVGYTNAGKSSLLNALTKKGAYVANALFATLDTHVGKIWIPTKDGRGKEILISDTIGFIQDLPPQLIDAFRSTLDETIDADLLLHVIDVSDKHVHEKIKEVEQVLKQIGADAIPKIYVFNKMDLVKRKPAKIVKDEYKAFQPAFVSAHSGVGLAELKTLIAETLGLD